MILFVLSLQVKVGEPPIINVALKIAYKFVRLTENIHSESAQATKDAGEHRTIVIRYEEHTVSILKMAIHKV